MLDLILLLLLLLALLLVALSLLSVFFAATGAGDGAASSVMYMCIYRIIGIHM
jgi:hypothetical protein